MTVQVDTKPAEHLQEELIEGVYRVVLYRDAAACCDVCDKPTQLAGPGEILGSRIGPQLGSIAIFLRNVIGISYRKVALSIKCCFGCHWLCQCLSVGSLTTLAEALIESLFDDTGKSHPSSA